MNDMLSKLVQDNNNRRERDAKRYADHDHDLCMLCHAYGADKRSLFIACGYAVHEAVPEAIDLYGVEGELQNRGYFLCLCKSCRGALLGHLQEWRNEQIARRNVPKDHDGRDEDAYGEHNIPVRVNGVTVLMDEYGYAEWKRKQEAK
jgi:hypothetical protein